MILPIIANRVNIMTKVLSVTHILWGLKFGGIETMLVNIMNAQVRIGLKVSCIVINNEILDELVSKIDPDVLFICLRRTVGSKNLLFIQSLNNKLDEIRPNIIHLHDSHIYNFIYKRHRKKTGCVETVHDMPYGKIGMSCPLVNFVMDFVTGMKGEVRCLNQIDQVCAISKSVADALSKQYNIPSRIVYNGISTSTFKRRIKTGQNPEFHIIQVSRLQHEKKGQDLLIEAVSLLHESGCQNVYLSFAGDGNSRDFLEQMVKRLKLEKYVEFLGGCAPSYIEQHLCDYDLLAQPSRYEGFGLTVAEGMAAGIPVIVSRGEGPEEITENERFGWTFENDNPKSLAEKILYVMNNREEVSCKCNDAYSHVFNNYDVDVTAKNYYNIYMQVYNKKIM